MSRTRSRRTGSTTTAPPTAAICATPPVALRGVQLPADQLLGALSHAAPEIKDKWGLPVLPAAVSDDPWGDAYAMVPIELDWSKVGGVAYDNRETGVRITHYPGDPLPQGVDRLQARMERPVDDLLGRHQARKDQHRAGEERRPAA